MTESTSTLPATAAVPLTVGETVSSASPAVDLGKSKAVVAAIGGVIAAVAPVLTVTLADGQLDVNEGIALVIAILAGLGIPGIGAYVVPTKVTRNI